jgi:DNA-binding NtrC family response regulator
LPKNWEYFRGSLENLSIQNTTPRKNIIPLAEVERLTIERAISLHAGNVVSAASALGVSPSTLYRKIQAWQN